MAIGKNIICIPTSHTDYLFIDKWRYENQFLVSFSITKLFRVSMIIFHFFLPLRLNGLRRTFFKIVFSPKIMNQSVPLLKMWSTLYTYINAYKNKIFKKLGRTTWKNRGILPSSSKSCLFLGQYKKKFLMISFYHFIS